MAELWCDDRRSRSTSRPSRLRPRSVTCNNFGWPDLGNMAIFAYLLSDREGKSEAIVEQYYDRAASRARTGSCRARRRTPAGRSLGGMYYWGINGVLVRTTAEPARGRAWIAGDAKYLGAAVAQLDHLFGRNYYGRSQITGSRRRSATDTRTIAPSVPSERCVAGSARWRPELQRHGGRPGDHLEGLVPATTRPTRSRSTGTRPSPTVSPASCRSSAPRRAFPPSPSRHRGLESSVGCGSFGPEVGRCAALRGCALEAYKTCSAGSPKRRP